MSIKARYTDGEIKIYNELPSKFFGTTGNYVGGFHLADVETQEQEGFFEVVEPDYNHVLEVLSPIYFDEEKKIFTYKVETKPDLPTLEQAKMDKISELKKMGREKFNETDWYYVRELRMKSMNKIKSVPQEVIDDNEYFYKILDEKEAKINALDNLEDVLSFNAVIDNKKEKDLLPEEIPAEPEVAPVEPAVEEVAPEGIAQPETAPAPAQETEPAPVLAPEPIAEVPIEVAPEPVTPPPETLSPTVEPVPPPVEPVVPPAPAPEVTPTPEPTPAVTPAQAPESPSL